MDSSIDLGDIISSFGDQNDDIDDDILDKIEEEIGTIEKKYYFVLAIASIDLGKPQILEYLFSIHEFSLAEKNKLYEEVQIYREIQLKKHRKNTDKEEINEIANEFISIVSNVVCKKKTSFKKY